MNRSKAVAYLLALMACGAFTSAKVSADSVATFYRDKTITIIVSFAPGGGFDLYARTLAQHIGNHIPGGPKLILQFMPGAGGVRAADYLANIAAKDGTVIGLMSNGIPIVQLVKKDVRFDVAKFTFIGRAAGMNTVTMVSSDLNVKSVASMRSSKMVFGSTGGGASDMHPNALKNVLGFDNIQVVVGYKGSADINLALEKGEVNAHSSAWASWKTSGASLVRDKKVVPLLEHAVDKSPDNPGVPLVLDLARNDLERKALTLICSDAVVGRAFIAPPGLPEDRIKALRTAFDLTMKDPAYLADATKRKMEIWPMSGVELQSRIEAIMASSPEVVSAAKSALRF